MVGRPGADSPGGAAGGASAEPAGATVLLGFAGAWSAPEAAWSLLDAGFRPVVFARRGRRTPLARCRGVRVVDIADPYADAARAADDLVRAADAETADAILPLNDAALWLADAVRTRTSAAVAGPVAERARLALDKRRQIRAAEAAGFRTIPTRTADARDSGRAAAAGAAPDAAAGTRPDSAHDIAPDGGPSAGPDAAPVGFPLVLKPALAVRCADGRLERTGVAVVRDRRELERALRRRRGSGPHLLQPRLAGVGQGLFGFAADDGVRAWSAHERIRMKNPRGSGSSACRSIPVDDALRAAAERLLRRVRWHGIFMIELLRDADGRTWFMELNGRCWGSTALARRRGLEYPAWAVRHALDPAFRPPAASPAPPPDREVVCRHLGREIVHLLTVLRGPGAAGHPAWPSRWRTAADVLRPDPGHHWYNHRPGELRFFLEDTLRTLRANARTLLTPDP